jgi:hypothetical protein
VTTVGNESKRGVGAALSLFELVHLKVGTESQVISVVRLEVAPTTPSDLGERRIGTDGTWISILWNTDSSLPQYNI